jgi:hypothetical protein
VQGNKISNGISQLVYPSGTTVVIGPYLSFVNVHVFATDMGRTSGLCGSFDRDSANDLDLPGTQTGACKYQPRASCEPFSEHWRYVNHFHLTFDNAQ